MFKERVLCVIAAVVVVSSVFFVGCFTYEGRHKISYDLPIGYVTSTDPNLDYAVFRANNRGTNVLVTEAVQEFSRVMWSFQPSELEMRSSPLVYKGKIYVGSNANLDAKGPNGGNLFALDAITGEVLWRFSAGHWIRSSPAYSEGLVYFGSRDKGIYAVDARNGDLMWKYETGGEVLSSPTFHGRTLFVGSQDGYIYSIDKKRGELNWRQRAYEPGIRSAVQSSPTVVDGVVYIATTKNSRSPGGVVQALVEETGAEKWRLELDTWTFGSPAVVDGIVYIGVYRRASGIFLALDSETGDIIWKKEYQSRVYSSSAVLDHTVFFSTYDGDLFALDAKSGDERWKFKIDGHVYTSPTIADGLIFIGDREGILHAVFVSTGKEAWNFDAGSRIDSTARVSDGVVYFGTRNGTLWALE